MKLCLLYLSVLTLLQLHSRSVTSAAKNVWLPNLQRLSSIIHICERKLSYENLVEESIIPNSAVKLIDLIRKPEKVAINSRISVNKQGSDVRASSKLDVKLGKSDLSISQSVDVNKKRDIIPILLRTKPLPNSQDKVEPPSPPAPRSLSVLGNPLNVIYSPPGLKRKYRAIAECVKRRLLKAYEEEMAFDD